MSGTEGKSEVQLTRPGPGTIFPFGSATAPPHPHITQWCRFAVSERLPLQPFRQDRLIRLPLPPSVMASSSKTAPPAPSVMPTIQDKSLSVDIDPFQKIQQLEKNLAFVQESHAYVLHSLHEEVSDLKQKNRELIFQLVTGFPSRPPQDVEKAKEKGIPPEAKEKIEKLEKEVRKLRSALKEALKVNNSLTNQLQMIKRERYASSSGSRCYSRTPPDSSGGDGHRTRTPNGPSPQMEDYSDTLRQIQRAAGHRSGKSSDSRHSDRMNGDWSGNYVENIRGYHHHHHHQQQQHQHQQPRLPRLPLRNQQQNYSHHQYEIQYRQRNGSTLPALKQPLIPVVEHRSDKPRKSRGSQRAKVLDHVSNH